MPSPTPARWLAPVALAGALVAVIVVASAGGGGGSGGDGGATNGSRGGHATHSTATSSTVETTPKTTAKTYTVRPGDVLSAIAEKTGVPLSEIEQLNPSVDAQSLHAGEKLKLAP